MKNEVIEACDVAVDADELELQVEELEARFEMAAPPSCTICECDCCGG